MKTHKLLIAAAALMAACSKPARNQSASHTPWNNPSAIGSRSVLINRDNGGNPYIYNPDNGATEEEPNRDAGLAKLPWSLTREVNPRDPQ
jgi:hypothetical protein